MAAPQTQTGEAFPSRFVHMAEDDLDPSHKKAGLSDLPPSEHELSVDGGVGSDSMGRYATEVSTRSARSGRHVQLPDESGHEGGHGFLDHPMYERSYSRSRVRQHPEAVVPFHESKIEPSQRLGPRAYLRAAIVAIVAIGAVVCYLTLGRTVHHPDHDLEHMVALLPNASTYYALKAGDPLEHVEYLVQVDFGPPADGTHYSLLVDVVQRQSAADGWLAVPGITQQASHQYGSDLLRALGSFDLTCGNCTGPEFALRFSATTSSPAAMWLHVVQLGNIGRYQVAIAGSILLLMYVGIATDVVHRTLVAMAGMFVTIMFLTILKKSPSLSMAFGWLDEGVLTLLFGMMVVVNVYSETGLFEWIAIRAYVLSGQKYTRLMVLLTLATAVLSAFLDNVTTMLLIAPVTIRLAKDLLHIDPRPLLIAECIMSNIGGTATMIGDPPNIIIGARLRGTIGFVDFIVNLAPCVVFLYGFCMAFLLFFYRKELKQPLIALDVAALKSEYCIRQPALLLDISIVFGAVLLLFFTEPVHHVSVAWTALMGAIMMLLLAHPHDIVHTLEHVEWDTLVFFSALFIMIEGLAEMGLIIWIGDTVRGWVAAVPEDMRLAVAILILLWVSGIVSAFLDNIPYTTTMVPVVLALGNDPELNLPLKPLAWALALGACLGGNGTLIGASANVVTVGLAGRHGYPISFMQWLKVGFPIVLLSLLLATAYCMVLYVAIGFGG